MLIIYIYYYICCDQLHKLTSHILFSCKYKSAEIFCSPKVRMFVEIRPHTLISLGYVKNWFISVFYLLSVFILDL